MLAPFRLVRLVLYGFFTVSATVGLVIALSQLAGGLADVPDALPLKGTLEVGCPCFASLSITVGFVRLNPHCVPGYLYLKDGKGVCAPCTAPFPRCVWSGRILMEGFQICRE